MCILLNAQLWHFMFTLFSSCSTFAHNHYQLILCLETDSLKHQVYTRDWDRSTMASRVVPHITYIHAFKKIISGFTLER